jgi:L-arabinose isomerase
LRTPSHSHFKSLERHNGNGVHHPGFSAGSGENRDKVVKMLEDRGIGVRHYGYYPGGSYTVGVSTLISLAAVEGERYRPIVSEGAILDTGELPGVPMHHAFFRPDSGIKKAMDEWLAYGGTHHGVLFSGDRRSRFNRLCKLLDIECAEV